MNKDISNGDLTEFSQRGRDPFKLSASRTPFGFVRIAPAIPLSPSPVATNIAVRGSQACAGVLLNSSRGPS